MQSSSHLYNSLLERLEGRPYGHYFAAWCVWDKHSTPAMLVFNDGMVKCLSCNKIWSHEQLNKKIGGHFVPQKNNSVSFRLLPKWRKWEEKYESLEGIVEYAHNSLKKHKQFQTYFKERKIYEFMESGSLGYLDGWAVFPVYVRTGEIVDLVARSISNHSDIRYVVHPSNGNHEFHPLYVPSWERLDKSDTVYVVYGLIDAISLHLAGLPVVTGVTGKSLSPELLKPLGKRLIIVPDDGEEKEAHLLANKLGWRAKVKKMTWPDKCKDTDDIRRLYGNEALLSALT